MGKALEYARLAGEAAHAALAPDDAIRWFTQALELQERQVPDDLATRCDLLIGLGDAQRSAGIAEHRDRLLEAAALAEQIGDDDRLVRSALACARKMQSYDHDPARVAILELALTRRPEPSTDRARLLAALSTETDARDWELARDRATEALVVARAIGDDATLLDVLTDTTVQLAQPDDLEQRRARVEEAMDLADRLGDRLAAFQSRYFAHQMLLESGDVAAADLVFEECARLADELALPYPRWQVAIDIAASRMRRGDFAAAERSAEEALALANRAGFEAGLGVYGGQLFYIRRAQGRIAEIAGFFLEAAAANPEIEALRVATIQLLVDQGKFEEARRKLATERAGGFSYSFTYQWLEVMCVLADVACRLDDHESGARLFELMAPYADRIVFIHAVAPRPFPLFIARAAQSAGYHDDVGRNLDLALDLAERLGSPYWTALVLLEQADRAAAVEPVRGRELATRAAAMLDDGTFPDLDRRVVRAPSEPAARRLTGPNPAPTTSTTSLGGERRASVSRTA